MRHSNRRIWTAACIVAIGLLNPKAGFAQVRLNEILDPNADTTFQLEVNEELTFEMIESGNRTKFLIKNNTGTTPDGTLFKVSNVHASGVGQEIAIFERGNDAITITGAVGMSTSGNATIEATNLKGDIVMPNGSSIRFGENSENNEGLILSGNATCTGAAAEGTFCYGEDADELCVRDGMSTWDCFSIGAGANSKWTVSGNDTYLTTTGQEVQIGTTSALDNAKFTILTDGGSQRGIAIDTASGATGDFLKFSLDGTQKFIVDKDGVIHSNSGIAQIGAIGALNLGNSDTDEIVFFVDGANTHQGTEASDKEFQVPEQSIAGAEILDDTITGTQLSGTLTFASSDVINMGIAFMEIPNDGAPVVSGATGRLALDTTDDQLILRGSASADIVIPTRRHSCYAIDSLINTDEQVVWVTDDAVTITAAWCYCMGPDCATPAEIVFSDDIGGLDMTSGGSNGKITCADYPTADAKVTIDTFNTLLALRPMVMDVTNNPTSNGSYALCWNYTITRE